MNNIFIALGSNLENPKEQVKNGILSIKKINGIKILSESNLYETPPVGILDQPNFVNAVIKIHSDLNPYKLIDTLLKIENIAGRIRVGKNGPRILDLDILLFNDLILNGKKFNYSSPKDAREAFCVDAIKRYR